MSNQELPSDVSEEAHEQQHVLHGRVDVAVNAQERDDALAQNADRSNGSLQKYVDKPIARSIEILAIDNDGNPVNINKENTLKEKQLSTKSEFQTREELKSEKQLRREQISQSVMMLAIEAEKNPVAEPIHLTRQYAENLPDGHPDKQFLRNLAREQASELTPELRNHYELSVSAKVIPKSLEEKPLENNLEGWQRLGEKIAELTPDQRFQLICGLLDQQLIIEKQKAIGGLIGTVQGLETIVMDTANVLQFAGDLMVNPQRAAQSAHDVGVSVWNASVGGIQLLDLAGQFGAQYTTAVMESGDYTKPFVDATKLGEELNRQWAENSPMEQERLKYKFVTEVLGAAIPIGGAGKYATVEKLTDIIKMVAQDAKAVGADLKIGAKACAEFVNNGTRIGTRLQPAGHAIQESNGFFDHLQNAGKSLKAKFEEFSNKMGKKVEHEPCPPLGDQGYRGDNDPYNPFHPKGWRKSHIDANGDLTPANPKGIYKGNDVTVTDHIDAGWNKPRKGNSPFTSFTVTDGKHCRYGDDKTKIILNIEKLKEGIADGKLPGVEIIDHPELVKAIEDSTTLSKVAKDKQLFNVRRDHEFLVKGIIPKGYFTVEK